MAAMIEESCWRSRCRSGSGSCNIIVAQRRRRNRFSGHRWSHAAALQLMVAVLILPYGTNALTVPERSSTDLIEFTTEIAEEFVTTTSADFYSQQQQLDSERTSTAVVNTTCAAIDDIGGNVTKTTGASDDFVGSNVEFRESALTENLEETIRNSVKNEIEMEQNNGLNSNAKTKQGEKLAEDILHMEYALKDSELDNTSHKSNDGQQGERKDREHDNNINNDIPEVEQERGNNKESVREARNLDPDLEQEHNMLAELHDDAARVKNISSSSLESSSSESYSYDSNDENGINSIDSDDDNSANVQRIEELITSSTVRALKQPAAEPAPKLTTTAEPEVSIMSTEIIEAGEAEADGDGESHSLLNAPAQSESKISMSSSSSYSESSESLYASSASGSVSNEWSSTNIEDSPPTFEPHHLDVVDAERQPTEIPVSPETTLSDDKDGDVLSIVFNETLSAKESIVLQVDEQLQTEPMSNNVEEKADEDASDQKTIIPEDDMDKHVVIKKQGVVIDDPLPKTEDDEPLDIISNVPITPIDRTQEVTEIVDDIGVNNYTNSDAGETLNPSTNAALPDTSLSPTSDSQDHDGSVTEDLSETVSSRVFEYAISTPAASSQADDTAATLFDTPAPRNVGQTFNENLAAESSAGIGKALPKRGISVTSSFSTTEYRSTAIILLSAGIVALLFMIIAIFLITFQRQQGTLDIEMQEKRCGKDAFDEENETCMKLLEVELPPVAIITTAAAQETDECL